MKIKICLFLITVLLNSCSSERNIYFISDNFTRELLEDNNIIEEIKRTAEKSNYNFKLIHVESKKDIESKINNLDMSAKDKIIFSGYSYINFFNDDMFENRKIYIIGPLFDLNREKIDHENNFNSIISEISTQIKTDDISFYLDDNADSFPEKEIISSIISPLENYNNDIKVTYNSFSDIKLSGFTDNSSGRIAVIVPEGSLNSLLSSITEIKNRYIIYDFGDLTSLSLFSSLSKPLFILKYSYIKSFEAVISHNVTGSGKQVMYSCYFEKK